MTDLIWIGDRFAERRILVLGESWYGDYADNTDTGYIRLYLAGKLADRMYTRMANACGLSRDDFWHGIAFTNFAQRVGEKREDRPTLAMYEAAKPRLSRLLAELQPRGVWILGKEQGEHSAPLVAAAGIPLVVSRHPTSYGVPNAELGADWSNLLERS